MEEFVKTFHIDWMLMLSQGVNFLIVFAIFYLLAAKPLRKLMHERTEEISTGLSNAEENKKLLANTKEEYAKVIAEARKEAKNILDENKKEAQKKKEEMLEATKAEVATMLASGKQSLEEEKAKMIREAKGELANLVVNATEKVLGAKVDTSYSERAIKELSNI